MTPELRDALMAAGWAPDRSVPTDAWVDALRSRGYSVVPVSVEILRSFGGLTVQPVLRPGDPVAPETLVFEPLGNADREVAEHWEGVLGKKLSPIAEVGPMGCLLVADSGEVYKAWDRYLFKSGDSLEDALENNLVFGRRRAVEIASM